MPMEIPGFREDINVWMQNFNGVYALAGIRGGGDYGEDWHRDGILDKK